MGSRKKWVSHVVLEELNGGRENAQHFDPVALCVAGAGQFAPQQPVATACTHLIFAWARDPSGRTIVNARARIESLHSRRRMIFNDPRHCKEHCRDWNVLDVIIDYMTQAQYDAKTSKRWRTFYQPMPKRWAAIESGTSLLRTDQKGIFLAAEIYQCPSSPALFSHLLWSSAPSRASRAFARKALMAVSRRSFAMVPAAPIGTTRCSGRPRRRSSKAIAARLSTR